MYVALGSVSPYVSGSRPLLIAIIVCVAIYLDQTTVLIGIWIGPYLIAEKLDLNADAWWTNEFLIFTLTSHVFIELNTNSLSP